MKKRLASVGGLIQKDLSAVMRRVLEFPPACLVTITRVRIGPDLQSAKVYISIMPAEKTREILKILAKNRIILQQELVKNLRTKFSPRIKFISDADASRADRIERILDGLQNPNE